MSTTRRAALITLIAPAALAQAQTGGPFALTWSTFDSGGGLSQGGTFTLTGTIGQPDAAQSTGAAGLLLAGGFWGNVTQPCYPNCDGSTSVPILNALDFSCFLTRYRQALALPAAEQIAAYANCDGSTNPPALNALDFSCYLQRFRAGCP